MRRPSLIVRVTLVPVFALVASLTGCKSGVGERCQVNDDCEDGLVCIPGTDTCGDSVAAVDGGQIDAPLDASTDAPTDASTDAPPDGP